MAGNSGNSHGAMVTFPETSEFPNMPLDGVDRRFMAMPAYLGGSFNAAGMKWYGSNMGNREVGLPRSIHLFVLNDKDTGAPLLMMSGNLLSAYRTGAVPGVGAKYLALPDASTVAIIGPGVMGKTGLEAYAAVRPIETVKVLGRRAESSLDYAKWLSERLPNIPNVIICDSVEEAVDGADIIHSGVSGPVKVDTYPYIKTEWLKPGAFVCSVANLRLDDELLLSPNTGLFIDNLGMYFDWQEEFGYPAYETTTGIIGTHFADLIHDGLLPKERVTNIGDVPLGKKPGRTSDDQIIVFSVGGMPIEDVAWSTEIYRRAIEQGIGVDLPLWDSPALH